MITGSLADLTAEINKLRAQHDGDAEQLVTAFSALFDAVQWRVSPPADGGKAREEVVSLTVHGVDVIVRGRVGLPGDLYVRIDDVRDRDERTRILLAVEVNGGGVTYQEQVSPCSAS